jgi:hypothetical protein
LRHAIICCVAGSKIRSGSIPVYRRRFALSHIGRDDGFRLCGRGNLRTLYRFRRGDIVDENGRSLFF